MSTRESGDSPEERIWRALRAHGLSEEHTSEIVSIVPVLEEELAEIRDAMATLESWTKTQNEDEFLDAVTELWTLLGRVHRNAESSIKAQFEARKVVLGT